MNLGVYLDKMSNAKAENHLLKLAVVLFGLATMVSSFTAYSMAKNQRVVILPPVVDRRIEISGNDANDAYLKLYAKYALHLLLDYSPASYADQANDLLRLATPTFYEPLSQKLMEIKKMVETLKINSQFHLLALRVDRKAGVIHATGTKRRMAQGDTIEEAKVTYVIGYEIRDGRLWINGIQEKIY